MNLTLDYGTIVGSSGEQTDNPAHKLIDGISGDDSNRWSNQGLGVNDQFVEIDLGMNFELDSFKLDSYQNRAYQFFIQTKGDGGVYTTVVDQTANSQPGPIDSALTMPVTARYIKLNLTGASGYTGDWVSLREFEAFGKPVPKHTGQNLAYQFGVINAVSGEQTENPAANLIDGLLGDDSNRWSADGLMAGKPYVEIDLGSNFKLASFHLDSFQNRAYQFFIETKSDEGSYERVVDLTSNSEPGAFDAFLPEEVAARYIKITVTGASGYTGDWASFREFQAYGMPMIENVAEKSGVISSSSGAQDENTAQNLIDGIMGDDNNRWSISGLASHPWVEIDLQRNYDLDSMVLDTYQNRDYQFMVEVKPEGGEYSMSLDMGSNMDAGPIAATFVGKPMARYVRFTILGANTYTGDWVSLRELQLFGLISAMNTKPDSYPPVGGSSTGSNGPSGSDTTGSGTSTGSDTTGSGSASGSNSSGPDTSGGGTIPTGTGSSSGGSTAMSFLRPGGVNTIQQIYIAAENIKKGVQPWASAWSKLQNDANKRLDEQPSPVVDYEIIPYYDDPQTSYRQSQIMQADVWSAYSASAVYAINIALTGTTPNNDKYANQSIKLLNAWASVNKNASGDEQTDLMMSVMVPGFISAAEMVWDYPGWKAADRQNFFNWIKNVIDLAADAKKARSLVRKADGSWAVKSGKTYYNNHNCWGILLALWIDQFTQNQADFDDDVKLLKFLIDMMIMPDGTMPTEMSRHEKSINYTAFALEPLTAAIELVRNSGGENLYYWVSPRGGSVKKALEYLFNKGIENPSLWPIDGAAEQTKMNSGHTPELFAAMGRVYGVSKWTNWGNPPVADIETGVGFPLPTLLQPLPWNAPQSVLTVGTPTNLRVQ